MKASEILKNLVNEGYVEQEIADACGSTGPTINRIKNGVHKNTNERTYVGLLNIWNKHQAGEIQPKRSERAGR